MELLDQLIIWFQQSPFFNQPIDVVFFQLLVWVGWIPIVSIMGWGFTGMWKNYRQGQFVGRRKYVLLAIDVPAMTEQTPKVLENMFAHIYGAKSATMWHEEWIYGKLQPTFQLEIASNGGYVQFYIRTETRFRDAVEAGIYAHYPEAEIYEAEDYVHVGPKEFPHDEWNLWGAELRQKKPFIFPIRTYVDFEDRMSQEIKDPLANILEQMAKMKQGEYFWIQIIAQPAENDWTDESEKYVKEVFGEKEAKKVGFIQSMINTVFDIPSHVAQEALGVDPFSLIINNPDAPEEADAFQAFRINPLQKERIEAVTRKAGKPGYNCKIRLVYLARKEVYWKTARTAMVKGMYGQYNHLNLNGFGLYASQVPKDDYFWQTWVYDKKATRLLNAYRSRSFGTGANPMLLNAEELASMWHFPAVQIKAPLVKKAVSRRAEPPVDLPMTFENAEETETGPAPAGPPAGLPGAGAQSAMPADLPAAQDPVVPSVNAPTAENPSTYAPVVHATTQPSAPVLPTPERPTKREEGKQYVPPNLPM